MNRNRRVGTIVDSFVQRHRAGQPVSIDEYARQHPDFEEEIRELIPSVMMLEELKTDLSDQGSEREVAPIPEKLGDYRIIREVGRGGMGIVYEAEDMLLRRQVALKILPHQATLDPDLVRRFRREAQAAARLHHTSIVHVYGVGEEHGIHFIVMELLRGKSLDRIIAQQVNLFDTDSRLSQLRVGVPTIDQRAGTQDDSDDLSIRLPKSYLEDTVEAKDDDTATHRLRPAHALREPHPRSVSAQGDRLHWKDVVRVGIQVAEALEHAHLRGTIHRDIKPSNLLLDAHGVVRVTDFGLAKIDAVADVTSAGNLLGTLRYLAPESLDDKFDVRSDVYSLGLTLFELATLQPARRGSTQRDLIQEIVNGTVVAPRQLCPQIPRDLETILQKAVRDDPQRRYQSAAALAGDLRRCLRDEPILARRVPIWERCYRTVRRNPLLWLALAAAILSIGIAVASVFVTVDARRRHALEVANHSRSMAREEAVSRRAAETARAEQARLANVARTVTEVLVRDLILPFQSELEQGNPVTLREAVDRAAARMRGSFSDQPEIRAALQEAIGVAYLSMGAYSQSQPLLEAAYQWRRLFLGIDNLETLRTMLNLAACHERLGQGQLGNSLREDAMRRLRQNYDDAQAEKVLSEAHRTESQF